MGRGLQTAADVLSAMMTTHSRRSEEEDIKATRWATGGLGVFFLLAAAGGVAKSCVRLQSGTMFLPVFLLMLVSLVVQMWFSIWTILEAARWRSKSMGKCWGLTGFALLAGMVNGVLMGFTE